MTKPGHPATDGAAGDTALNLEDSACSLHSHSLERALFPPAAANCARAKIGSRVRFKRPRSNTWREGTVKRYSYEGRSGTPLLQVTVDTVGGGRLTPPTTARIAETKVEVIS